MFVMMLDRDAIIGLNWNVNDNVELRSEYGLYGDANDDVWKSIFVNCHDKYLLICHNKDVLNCQGIDDGWVAMSILFNWIVQDDV